MGDLVQQDEGLGGPERWDGLRGDDEVWSQGGEAAISSSGRGKAVPPLA